MITAVDTKSKVAYTFTDAAQLTDAMVNSGFVPILPDGSAAKVQSFEGGYLIQGAPLNVWMEGAWWEGQPEILGPHWKSGEIPTPPPSLMALPVLPMPENVLAPYANYKGTPGAQTALEAYQSKGPGLDLSSVLSSPYALLAIGGVAWMLFSGSRRRGA